MSVYKNPVCKGSWALGTACGKCERCEETRPMTTHSDKADDLFERLLVQADGSRTPSLLKEAAAYIKQLKAALVEADRKNEAMLHEWNSAEARATKAEEALRRIKARATTHPDDNDSDRKRDLRHVVGIAQEALGEEKA